MQCDYCGGKQLSKDVAGFYICQACGTIAENIRATERDTEDVIFEYTGNNQGEGIYDARVTKVKRSRIRTAPEEAPECYFDNDFNEVRDRPNGVTEADCLWGLQRALELTLKNACELYELGSDGVLWQMQARVIWFKLLKIYRRSGKLFRSIFADGAGLRLLVPPQRVPGLLQQELPQLNAASLHMSGEALRVLLSYESETWLKFFREELRLGDMLMYLQTTSSPALPSSSSPTSNPALSLPFNQVALQSTPDLWKLANRRSYRWNDWSSTKRIKGAFVSEAEVLKALEARKLNLLKIWTSSKSSANSRLTLGIRIIYAHDLLYYWLKSTPSLEPCEEAENPLLAWLLRLHSQQDEIVTDVKEDSLNHHLPLVSEAVLQGTPSARAKILMTELLPLLVPEESELSLDPDLDSFFLDSRCILPIICLSARRAQLPILSDDILRWAVDGRFDEAGSISLPKWLTGKLNSPIRRKPAEVASRSAELSAFALRIPINAQALEESVRRLEILCEAEEDDVPASAALQSIRDEDLDIFSFFEKSPTSAPVEANALETKLVTPDSTVYWRRLLSRFVKYALLPPKVEIVAQRLFDERMGMANEYLAGLVLVAGRLTSCAFRYDHKISMDPWANVILEIFKKSTDYAVDLRGEPYNYWSEFNHDCVTDLLFDKKRRFRVMEDHLRKRGTTSLFGEIWADVRQSADIEDVCWDDDRHIDNDDEGNVDECCAQHVDEFIRLSEAVNGCQPLLFGITLQRLSILAGCDPKVIYKCAADVERGFSEERMV